MKSRPVSPPFLPYGRQWIGSDDVACVAKVLRSDWLTQGPAVESFEHAFAKQVGARHAVAVSSGTAALHAACFAAGIGPGDEVVVPPLTFVATSNAVLYQGARPVFSDVDPDTGLLDPALLERLKSRRIKAVLPVDYAGHPCDLDRIRRIARRRGWTVIEDAAHSLGATYRGRPVGSVADLTTFSFHPVKHITTGEGGMVTTDDDRLAGRLRLFRQHGITRDPKLLSRNEGPWYYEMQELGFNYRITDFQCALGSTQLRKLSGWIRARRSLAALYDRLLAGVKEILRPVERPWARHAYHLYPVRLDLSRIKTTRRQVFEGLRARGLGVQVHYIPVHLQPYYRRTLKTRPGEFPQAEAFYASEISLPMFPRMIDRDVRRVVAALQEELHGEGAAR